MLVQRVYVEQLFSWNFRHPRNKWMCHNWSIRYQDSIEFLYIKLEQLIFFHLTVECSYFNASCWDSREKQPYTFRPQYFRTNLPTGSKNLQDWCPLSFLSAYFHHKEDRGLAVPMRSVPYMRVPAAFEQLNRQDPYLYLFSIIYLQL